MPAPAAAPAAPRDAGISPDITGRTTAEVLALWRDGEIVMEAGDRLDPLGLLVDTMHEVTVGCDSSILSLGEGRSSFIHQLLVGRRRYLALPAPSWSKAERTPCETPGIHALDVSYPAHDPGGRVTDERQPSDGQDASLATYDSATIDWIREFPGSYHSQLFQELDLRDESGQRMRFSLVLSVYALSKVMCQFLGADERRATLRRVLDHVEPGGALLMTHVGKKGKGCFASYYDELAKMKQEGLVTTYNVVPESRRASSPLVVLR